MKIVVLFLSLLLGGGWSEYLKNNRFVHCNYCMYFCLKCPSLIFTHPPSLINYYQKGKDVLLILAHSWQSRSRQRNKRIYLFSGL